MKLLGRLGLLLVALAAFSATALAGPYYTGLKVYVGQRNWPKAISVGPLAIEQDSDNPDAYQKYAIALAELDSLEHAGMLFQRGHELAEKKKDDKLIKDIDSNREHYYAGHFNKSLALYKDAGDILDSLGTTADTTKADVKAVMSSVRVKVQASADESQKAIWLKPTDAKIWSQYGVALGRLGRYDEALRAYDKSLSIAPDYENARENKHALLTNMALDCERRGDWTCAARIFEDQVAHGDTTMYSDLGNVYFNQAKATQGDTLKVALFKKSAENFGRLYRANPADTTAAFNYVLALTYGKDYASAEPVLKRLLGRNPYSTDYHAMLQNVYGMRKNSSGAIAEKLAGDALSRGKLLPASPRAAAVTDAGKVMARLGKPERAYEFVDSGFTTSVWFYVNKGELYAFIADKQVGKSAWTPSP